MSPSVWAICFVPYTEHKQDHAHFDSSEFRPPDLIEHGIVMILLPYVPMTTYFHIYRKRLSIGSSKLGTRSGS
jgi:hypothetical protein